jgi:hypothetical protein
MAAIPTEVFLSHSATDRALADRVAALLRHHGIPVWYSATNILGAQQWHDQIGKALARCDWFLVVLSPSAVKSKWVGHEYFYALNDDRYAGRIVPVLYKPCNWKRLSWTLRQYQWVDFTKHHDLACRGLLRTWGLRV